MRKRQKQKDEEKEKEGEGGKRRMDREQCLQVCVCE